MALPRWISVASRLIHRFALPGIVFGSKRTRGIRFTQAARQAGGAT